MGVSFSDLVFLRLPFRVSPVVTNLNKSDVARLVSKGTFLTQGSFFFKFACESFSPFFSDKVRKVTLLAGPGC